MRKHFTSRGGRCLGVGLLALAGMASAALWQNSRAVAAAAFDAEALSFSGRDRVMVLVPHPDDETLACGGVIRQCVAMGIPVRVVFLTYGDDNEWSFLVYRKRPVLESSSVRNMGHVRHDEAVAATGILGLAPTNLVFLGYPDFGTLRIWLTHWGAKPAFRGLLTGARSVPYADAFRPGAPYKGQEILADLKAMILGFRPTRIFVSHPADHNPDHQALYLFTRIALWDLEKEVAPRLYPYLVHFTGWPKLRGFHPDSFLLPPPAIAAQANWSNLILAPESIARKKAALLAHRSQCEYSARYLLSFVCANEIFSDFIGEPPAETTVAKKSGVVEAYPAPEPSPELTEEERTAFIGLSARRVRAEGTNLLVELELSKPLGRAVETSIYVSGYRTDTPFESMPKIQVRLDETRSAAYDQDTELPKDSVDIVRRARRITVRIPMKVIGNPQRVLTSVRTHLGPVPLDWMPWRMLINGEGRGSGDHVNSQTGNVGFARSQMTEDKEG